MSTVHTFSGAGDVWFSLNGTTYQNNSLVALEDIGERDDVLLCRTTLTDCCRPSYAYTGFIWLYPSSWFFPNGTRVPNEGKQWGFYRDRGQMVIQLYRRRGGVGGIYSCEIPDSMNVIRTIYIGMYTANTGEFYMYDTLFSYSCTCIYYTAYAVEEQDFVTPPRFEMKE